MTAIFGGVERMGQALDFHMDRQNLISGNIANVDTPGYAPRELHRPDSPASFEQMVGAKLRVTDGSHFAAGPRSAEEGWKVSVETDAVAGNDQNYVDIEREMSRLAANTLRYQAVSKTVTSQLGMIRYAANDARG